MSAARCLPFFSSPRTATERSTAATTWLPSAPFSDSLEDKRTQGQHGPFLQVLVAHAARAKVRTRAVRQRAQGLDRELAHFLAEDGPHASASAQANGTTKLVPIVAASSGRMPGRAMWKYSLPQPPKATTSGLRRLGLRPGPTALIHGESIGLSWAGGKRGPSIAVRLPGSGLLAGTHRLTSRSCAFPRFRHAGRHPRNGGMYLLC